MSKGEAKTSDNFNQMNESMEKRCFLQKDNISFSVAAE